MFSRRRNRMVDEQIIARGIRDERVIEAMRHVPRDAFVPEHEKESAYEDRPLPIGEGQTISQPYIVALMSELCGLTGGETVLEVGTGSGYQTAMLASLARQVYSIELFDSLSKRAQKPLNELGFENITFIVGNGYNGYPDAAPFDVVILTAAPSSIPQRLIEQLKEGGRLVGPVGRYSQKLIRGVKVDGQLQEKRITAVAFVPMVDR